MGSADFAMWGFPYIRRLPIQVQELQNCYCRFPNNGPLIFWIVKLQAGDTG